MNDAFYHHRDAALALLTSGRSFNKKEGQFLGQLSVDSSPLSERQLNWLNILLRKWAFPPLVG